MSEVNIDALLDGTLDDIADLPEFVTFPNGIHRAQASFELAKDGSAIYLKLTYMGSEDLEDPESPLPSEGDLGSVRYSTTNEFGMGSFKKVAAVFAEALNLSSNREIIETVQGVDVVVVTKQAANKKDPEKPFMNIKEIGVA